MKTPPGSPWFALRRSLLICAGLMCALLPLPRGQAQTPTAVATLTSGGATSINIMPLQTFVLALDVTTNFLSSGYTTFYQSVDGGAPFFQLIALSNTSPIHPETGMHVFITPGSPPLGDGLFRYGPQGNSNQFDLGMTGDQTHNQPPGSFSLQTVTIRILANAIPGTYTIRLDPRSIMTERTMFQDVNMGGASGPMFTVHIIPEPGVVWLLLSAVAILLAVMARKHDVLFRRARGRHR